MTDDEIKQTKDAAGTYIRHALGARKIFIGIRARQDPEIRALYVRLADRVASRIGDTARPLAPFKQSHLERVEQMLRVEADRLRDGITFVLKRDIRDAVEAGAGISSGVTFQLLEAAGIRIDKDVRASCFRVNNRAVENIWRRHTKGFKLSDRIWQQGEKAREAVQDILQEAVATGQSAVDTAGLLQQYIRKGAMSLAADYPNMMERLQAPRDISYEALRLARSETSKAYWDGAVEAGRNSPSYIGVRWVLSHSHPVPDVCDAYAEHNEGLGRGVYGPGNEPSYPHPNCICTIVAVHEQPEEFVKKLKRWEEDPAAEPKIEKWYQGVHVQERPGGTSVKHPEFLRINNKDKNYDDAADRKRVKEDLAIIPSGHRKILEQEGVTVQTGHEISRYDRKNKVIQIGKNPVPGEVFHEVGHAIETKLDLYHSDTFLDILKNGLPDDNEIVLYIKTDKRFNPEIEVLDYPNSKFISIYQSRLYDVDIDKEGRINYDLKKFNPKVLGEYFSEGYRAYITDPEILKKKDPVLYKFIKELID